MDFIPRQLMGKNKDRWNISEGNKKGGGIRRRKFVSWNGAWSIRLGDWRCWNRGVYKYKMNTSWVFGIGAVYGIRRLRSLGLRTTWGHVTATSKLCRLTGKSLPNHVIRILFFFSSSDYLCSLDEISRYNDHSSLANAKQEESTMRARGLTWQRRPIWLDKCNT